MNFFVKIDKYILLLLCYVMGKLRRNQLTDCYQAQVRHVAGRWFINCVCWNCSQQFKKQTNYKQKKSTLVKYLLYFYWDWPWKKTRHCQQLQLVKSQVNTAMKSENVLCSYYLNLALLFNVYNSTMNINVKWTHRKLKWQRDCSVIVHIISQT